jgi:dGTPase
MPPGNPATPGNPAWCYDEFDRQRLTAEPPKDTGAHRTPFQRDRARVLHSAALRRLAAKTQVVVAGQDDFPRTRLTHSLEVAQIAREMGEELGCDPDITDTAGLAHDLGHPPFGHNGESVLNELAVSCGGFEGNAQTLRVLTRLEAKVLTAEGKSTGLNLTRATLDACCKYPWLRQEETPKFGVYDDDLEVFEWIRDSGLGVRRCLEAQVMDWADDVAYSVHDVEDGVHGGYIRLAELAGSAERDALCELAAQEYSGESPGWLREVLDELLGLPVVVAAAAYDGTHPAQAGLKRLTSVLTGRFIAAAVRSTQAEYGFSPLARYAADLVVPRKARAECTLLKTVALKYVMRREGAVRAYHQQRELLTELVGLLRAGAPDVLDLVFRPQWRDAPDEPARLRVVIDQVASLTDASVGPWLRRLRTGL